MPFELWLTPGGSPDTWDPQALARFLSERSHWAVDAGWAIHEHPDSGVYFALIWTPPADVDPAPWHSGRRLLFRLNTLRPRYFGLAAELELDALRERFAATIETLEPWSVEAFRARWEELERAAFAALGPSTQGLFPFDPAALVDIWRWNDRRRWLQGLMPELFVPKVQFSRVGESARSTIVWTDVVPAVIPAVDRVLVLRATRGQPGLIELPQDVLVRLAGPPARVPQVALPQRVIGRPSAELLEWVEAAAPIEPSLLAPAEVVDADLLALGRSQA